MAHHRSAQTRVDRKKTVTAHRHLLGAQIMGGYRASVMCSLAGHRAAAGRGSTAGTVDEAYASEL